MKKIISAMLLITVLFASFPVWQPATAIELDDDIGFEYRDEVYYSDLFTMYSQYLYEDGMAEIVNDDYQKVLSEVYEDFKNNSDYHSM